MTDYGHLFRTMPFDEAADLAVKIAKTRVNAVILWEISSWHQTWDKTDYFRIFPEFKSPFLVVDGFPNDDYKNLYVGGMDAYTDNQPQSKGNI